MRPETESERATHGDRRLAPSLDTHGTGTVNQSRREPGA